MSGTTPGQASWIARNRALGAPEDVDMLLTWPYLDPEQREAEEAGARAAVVAYAGGIELRPARRPLEQLAAALDGRRIIVTDAREITGPGNLHVAYASDPAALAGELLEFIERATETAAAAPVPAHPPGAVRVAQCLVGDCKWHGHGDSMNDAVTAWTAHLAEAHRLDWPDDDARTPDGPGRPATSLEVALPHDIDGLSNLIRDMLQAFPDTADEQEWRDRAGALAVLDPDGNPYRAYTEEDL